MRPDLFLEKWRDFQQQNTVLKQAVTEQTEALSAGSDMFFEQIVGFKPYPYQKEFIDIFENNQFTAARWCRQSGKTQTISALLLKYAVTHPNVAIGVVGPSWRQSKRIIARIAAFAHKLPAGIAFKPQKNQTPPQPKHGTRHHKPTHPRKTKKSCTNAPIWRHIHP